MRWTSIGYGLGRSIEIYDHDKLDGMEVERLIKKKLH
jgi:hypothetical protein